MSERLIFLDDSKEHVRTSSETSVVSRAFLNRKQDSSLTRTLTRLKYRFQILFYFLPTCLYLQYPPFDNSALEILSIFMS